MKRSLEISNQPEQVACILRSLKNDHHLSKTFEGNIKNGLLTGFYTNLALVNGMVIGYVKIKGQYDREQGNLQINTTPSKLYFGVLIFCMIAITISCYKAFSENKLSLIGSGLFTLMALVITLAYLLESRSFIKHIQRVAQN